MHILLLAAGLVALLLIAGMLYQISGTARDRRRFPPPGRMVDIGGTRLHLLDTGEGATPVILESGLSASCLNWTQVRSETTQFARVLSYDRASLGWSDPADTPRILSRVAAELHALLLAAEIPAPCILVGHSFGGLLVRAYAVQHPDRVAGLVLVDPLSAAEWLHLTDRQARMLRFGVRLSRRGQVLARLGVVRASLSLLTGAGPKRIPQMIAKLSSGSGESAISRLVGEVRKMPPETWPMVQAHWCLPESFAALGQYFEALPASSAEANALATLPPIPLTILSASNAPPERLAERDALVARSPHGKHIVAAGSGHWIQLDEPRLVVDAIREMLEHTKDIAR